MAENLGDAVLELRTDSRNLNRGLSKAESRTAQFSRQARVAAGRAAKMGAAFGAAAAAGVGLLVRNQLQAIQTTQRLIEVSGVAGRTIEALRISARDFGIEQERIGDAVIDFSEKLGEARQGTGEAIEGFELLASITGRNIDLSQDVNAVFAQVVTAMGEVGDASTRAAIGAQLGGDAFRDILPIINQGSAALADAASKADRLGLSFTQIEAAQVRLANEAIAEAQTALTGLTRVLTIELAPIISSLATNFASASAGAGDFRSQVITTMENTAKAVGFVADVIEGVRRLFRLVGQAVATAALQIRAQMIEAREAIISGPVDALNALIRTANKIPGIDFGEVEQFEIADQARADLERARAAVEEGKAAMQRTLMEPMPSTGIEAAFDRMRADAEKAAVETVKRLREIRAATGGGGAGDGGGAGGGADTQFLADKVISTTDQFEADMETLRERQARAEAAERAHLARLEQMRRQSQGRLFQSQMQFLDSMELAQKTSGAAQVGIMTNAFAQITAAGAQHNRELFELNKAAGIANAIVATYQGAAQALRDVPYPWNLAAAATVIASGMAKVNAIRSQSFQGGGGAAPSTSAGGGVPAVQDVSGQGQAEQAGTRQNVTVQFVGSRTSARDARALLEELRDAAGDDATLGDITFQGA